MTDDRFELLHGMGAGRLVCGVDEVGRGPLAGPVFAAAAFLPAQGLPASIVGAVRDSKKLSVKKREALFPVLIALCPHAIASSSVEEIDDLNILNAALLAMTRAVQALNPVPDHALIDGNKTPPELPCSSTPIIGGDDKSLSIAIASIIAKVTRDKFMTELAVAYPGYGWEKNAGYGTAEHLKALCALGPTPWHRHSFAPVRRVGGDVTAIC